MSYRLLFQRRVSVHSVPSNAFKLHAQSYSSGNASKPKKASNLDESFDLLKRRGDMIQKLDDKRKSRFTQTDKDKNRRDSNTFNDRQQERETPRFKNDNEKVYDANKELKNDRYEQNSSRNNNFGDFKNTFKENRWDKNHVKKAFDGQRGFKAKGTGREWDKGGDRFKKGSFLEGKHTYDRQNGNHHEVQRHNSNYQAKGKDGTPSQYGYSQSGNQRFNNSGEHNQNKYGGEKQKQSWESTYDDVDRAVPRYSRRDPEKTFDSRVRNDNYKSRASRSVGDKFPNGHQNGSAEHPKGNRSRKNEWYEANKDKPFFGEGNRPAYDNQRKFESHGSKDGHFGEERPRWSMQQVEKHPRREEGGGFRNKFGGSSERNLPFRSKSNEAYGRPNRHDAPPKDTKWQPSPRTTFDSDARKNNFKQNSKQSEELQNNNHDNSKLSRKATPSSKHLHLIKH